MQIINPELLYLFASKSRCEWCEKAIRSGLDPHHVFCRGSGRLDIEINLIALCRVCHNRFHYGQPPRHRDLLGLVAERERCTTQAIALEIYRLRRLPKETKGKWANFKLYDEQDFTR